VPSTPCQQAAAIGPLIWQHLRRASRSLCSNCALPASSDLPYNLVRLPGKSAVEVEAVLAESRKLLHERRAQRPRPHLDDKVSSCHKHEVEAWSDLQDAAYSTTCVHSTSAIPLVFGGTFGLLLPTHRSFDSMLTAGGHSLEWSCNQRICHCFSHPGLGARTDAATLPGGGQTSVRLPAGSREGAADYKG
jgi:hypothetical protein